MQTLTITIANEEIFFKNALAHINKALATHQAQEESLNFTSMAAFFAHLSERKWLLLDCVLAHKAAHGAKPIAVRELARRLKRDVKRVHGDAQSLVALGLLEKTAAGALLCPYDEIRLDMVIKAGKQAA